MKLSGLHLSSEFQICIFHHGCVKYQIYGKLKFLEDVLSSQTIESRYFYSYATTSFPPPLPIAPAVSGNHDLEY